MKPLFNPSKNIWYHWKGNVILFHMKSNNLLLFRNGQNFRAASEL